MFHGDWVSCRTLLSLSLDVGRLSQFGLPRRSGIVSASLE